MVRGRELSHWDQAGKDVHFTTSLRHCAGSPSQAVRQGKAKGILIEKEDVKPSLFADDMLLSTENPRKFTRNLLDLISELSKIVECKINKQKSVTFHTNNEQSKNEIKITIL